MVAGKFESCPEPPVRPHGLLVTATWPPGSAIALTDADGIT
jgi:hypothetical protein